MAVVVVVVSHGKTKTMPAGRKRMERGVPRESGVVMVMEEGAGVRSGIHEEMMKDKGNPGQLVLLAVNQVVQFDNLYCFSEQYLRKSSVYDVFTMKSCKRKLCLCLTTPLLNGF
jgi:hypothetical protein